MDTITAMRVFSAVARHNSFTAGAKELGLSTKVASNHVRALEARLGVQLLYRTTRRVTLTDTGQAYYDRCIALLDQFDEVEGLVQAQQAELAGLIRVTAPTAFGSRELIDQALASFLSQHPKVQVDLRLADHRVNLIEEGFDLALRFGTLPDSNFLARKILDMRLVTYAAPAYLSSHGTPRHPAALATHNCLLQQSSAEPARWQYSDKGEVMHVRVDGSFRANSPRAVAHMAARGLGIGRTPHYVAAPFLQNGALKLLLEEYEGDALTLHAVYPGTRHLVARVRALIDHLVECFSPRVDDGRPDLHL